MLIVKQMYKCIHTWFYCSGVNSDFNSLYGIKMINKADWKRIVASIHGTQCIYTDVAVALRHIICHIMFSSLFSTDYCASLTGFQASLGYHKRSVHTNQPNDFDILCVWFIFHRQEVTKCGLKCNNQPVHCSENVPFWSKSVTRTSDILKWFWSP